MRFSRQGYWSGSPFPSPGDLPNSGIEPKSPELQADSLLIELQGKPPKEAKQLMISKPPHNLTQILKIFRHDQIVPNSFN